MKIIALAGAIVLALCLAACTDEQECRAAAFTYDQFVKSGRGGADEKAAAKKAFEVVQKRCLAKGINI